MKGINHPDIVSQLRKLRLDLEREKQYRRYIAARRKRIVEREAGKPLKYKPRRRKMLFNLPKTPKPKPPACACAVCKTCVHREVMRTWRAKKNAEKAARKRQQELRDLYISELTCPVKRAGMNTTAERKMRLSVKGKR